MSRDFELGSCVDLVHQDLGGRRHPSPPWASAALSLHARLAKARFELGDKNKTARTGDSWLSAISEAGKTPERINLASVLKPGVAAEC